VDNVLIVASEVDKNLYLAARNLHKVDVRDVHGVDPVSLVAFDKVMVTVDAVKKFEEMLGMNQERVFQVLLGPHVSEKAAMVATVVTSTFSRSPSTRPR
jgi:hypothetical protein